MNKIRKSAVTDLFFREPILFTEPMQLYIPWRQNYHNLQCRTRWSFGQFVSVAPSCCHRPKGFPYTFKSTHVHASVRTGAKRFLLPVTCVFTTKLNSCSHFSANEHETWNPTMAFAEKTIISINYVRNQFAKRLLAVPTCCNPHERNLDWLERRGRHRSQHLAETWWHEKRQA